LNVDTIPDIQAAIVAGAANNQLATPQDGDDLHARGILYLPDFLVNAGGIVSVAREYLGTGSEESVLQEVGHIRDRVTELLERAVGQAPARVAEAWAKEKLRA
jgi:leucine dehydrogenase